MNSDTVIEFKNVGIEFDGNWILRNVQFELKQGKSLAIIGPSGSGKSTILRLIAGLTEPSEGSIEVDRGKLGMLFQRNALFDSLSVSENLAFTAKEARGLSETESSKEVDELLKSVGLEDTHDLSPNELSGGMQKRLGIARTLIANPKIILYDEPTAGLDPITSRKIANLIELYRKERSLSIVVITNEMQRAFQLSDRIGFVANQKWIDAGTPEEAKNSTHPAIHQFIFGKLRGPLTREEPT